MTRSALLSLGLFVQRSQLQCFLCQLALDDAPFGRRAVLVSASAKIDIAAPITALV